MAMTEMCDGFDFAKNKQHSFHMQRSHDTIMCSSGWLEGSTGENLDRDHNCETVPLNF